MSATEHALAQQIHSLYSDHHGWLHGWLRKKLGCAHHAADLAHDTFVRLLVRPRELDSERNPRAYLSTIAHGLAVDHWRRQAIEQAWLETLAAFTTTSGPSPPTRPTRAIVPYPAQSDRMTLTAEIASADVTSRTKERVSESMRRARHPLEAATNEGTSDGTGSP